jgi:hypothetical protein
MPRISIQQFRATLAGGARPGTLVRAYRELARRPELALGARYSDWPVWTAPDGGTATT